MQCRPASQLPLACDGAMPHLESRYGSATLGLCTAHGAGCCQLRSCSHSSVLGPLSGDCGYQRPGPAVEGPPPQPSCSGASGHQPFIDGFLGPHLATLLLLSDTSLWPGLRANSNRQGRWTGAQAGNIAQRQPLSWWTWLGLTGHGQQSCCALRAWTGGLQEERRVGRAAGTTWTKAGEACWVQAWGDQGRERAGAAAEREARGFHQRETISNSSDPVS